MPHQPRSRFCRCKMLAATRVPTFSNSPFLTASLGCWQNLVPSAFARGPRGPNFAIPTSTRAASPRNSASLPSSRVTIPARLASCASLCRPLMLRATACCGRVRLPARLRNPWKKKSAPKSSMGCCRCCPKAPNLNRDKCFGEGHGFSPAKQPPKSLGALAPEEYVHHCNCHAWSSLTVSVLSAEILSLLPCVKIWVNAPPAAPAAAPIAAPFLWPATAPIKVPSAAPPPTKIPVFLLAPIPPGFCSALVLLFTV